jgi:hypothetical protein
MRAWGARMLATLVFCVGGIGAIVLLMRRKTPLGMA